MSLASPALHFGAESHQEGAVCSASRSCAGAEACSPHSLSMFYLEFLTRSHCLLGSLLLVSQGKRMVWAFAFIFLAFKYFSYPLGCCALCLVVLTHNLRIYLYSRMCATRPTFIQLTHVWRSSWSTSVLSTALLCLLEALESSDSPPCSHAFKYLGDENHVASVGLCFLASRLLVYDCLSMLSYFYLPETKHREVCVVIRECVLGGF